MTSTLRRTASFRFASACAVLGLVLAVLGAALVASRSSNEQAALDRTLSTTAGEKAALVETELERVRALALLTARIPPFSELYAEEGSKAAEIAAVAGPVREINEALTYLWRLYPNRLVEAGYVDRAGGENARVVRGRAIPSPSLSKDVARWPSFPLGVTTPAGAASITQPFMSPTAHVQVVAATAPVSVDGRIRAYVELELQLAAIKKVLATDIDAHKSGVAVVDGDGATIVAGGRSIALEHMNPRLGLGTSGHRRFAARRVPEAFGTGGSWYVVAAASTPSMASLVAVDPAELAVLGLALVLLGGAFFGFRRARAEAARELATEQQAREEAERRSRVDVLTGLFNRRHAMETIEHELDRSSRQGTALGLLMFDIDRFKPINDAHGHAAGDAVLIEVANRLRAAVRSFDVVTRVGGEEFAVIAPGMESEAAVAELGDRLRLSISERAITVAEGLALPVTASAGAALVHGGEGSAEHAIDCADRALYAAKRRGRNRLCRFALLDSADLRAEQPECLRIAEALAAAHDLREGAPDQHSRQVADLSAGVARRLGLPEDEILRVRLGGWLHDIGKVSVPDGILTKPGELTTAEWEIVRAHPVVGDELLRHFPELALACRGVRHHHERFDGTGYPDRLAADRIPLEARIVAAADAFSAMTSDRPHCNGRSREDAIEELRRCAGRQFDPEVVAALIDELHGRAGGAGLPAARAGEPEGSPRSPLLS